ncbi:hypothetical protein ACIBK1_14665 [Microbispora rosea]|uniref:hypothetical protein n=1 Tax=Microbispora rosea TaxID=58117 RepID=UPI00379F2C06
MASDPLTRATASLYGLALGDALGSQFFVPANREALTTRTLPPERVWSDDDWAVIRLGHRPVGMDDRWSAYVESDTLHLHRSWTGHQIYEARFGRTQGGRFVVAARVEADRGRHRRVGDAYDRLLLELLVDTILLQRHDPRRWDELASLR